MTRLLRFLIEYDGTNYHGWQRQAPQNREAGDLHQTIQGTIEDVLSGITKHPANVVAAGRTDAGVHATGQVLHFKTNLHISESSWVKAMNSLLPADIVVRKAEYVSEDFHARFDAKSKVYRYFILNSGLPSAFQRNYAWHIKRPLNISLIKEASQYLIGHHDFSSFRASDCGAKSPVKTLDRIEIDEVSLENPESNPPLPPFSKGGNLFPPFEKGGMGGLFLSSSVSLEPAQILLLTFEARSFLQHMVRNIVGTLAEVGRGKITPTDIKTILEKRDRRYAGPIAPPQGLYLSEVRY